MNVAAVLCDGCKEGAHCYGWKRPCSCICPTTDEERRPTNG